MKKIGIFYGSSAGMTAKVADKLASLLKIAPEDVHNVANTDPTVLADYELAVLGISTHGAGEMQPDWYDFLAGADVLDLRGHRLAIFGLGDQRMANTFCDAVGTLHDRLKDTGALFVGQYPADVYTFKKSKALFGDGAYGLLLDEVNRPENTDTRLKAWSAVLKG